VENEYDEPCILVAKDLTPSETVKLDKSKILGFVTFDGSPSSHTAILARAMSIPALVGVGDIPIEYNLENALLDSENGTLLISPTESEIVEFEEKRAYENKIAKEHERYLRSIMNRPAVTKSGHKVLIYANIGEESEIESALLNGAEGIGLLRSEFLYLSKSEYPTEEEMLSAYRNIASKMQGKRVVIRTLDVGADKQIPYLGLEKEENPALGYRGVRISLDRVDIFKSQLRAILRASAYGNISIMVPMITTLSEVKKGKQIINE
jgi:phosphotransferase system enzyme I (PtsI)